MPLKYLKQSPIQKSKRSLASLEKFHIKIIQKLSNLDSIYFQSKLPNFDT